MKRNHETTMPSDILILSDRPLWPLDQGFKVHGSAMAIALAQQGLDVGVAWPGEWPEDVSPELLALRVPWPQADAVDLAVLQENWKGPLASLRQRIARYQGLDLRTIAGVVALTGEHSPRVVLGVGLHGGLLASAARSPGAEQSGESAASVWRPFATTASAMPKRLWYAADELVNFNLSCLRREQISRWPARLRTLASNFALERAFAALLDGAIGVSPRETKLLRTIAGITSTQTIRNGVDTAKFNLVFTPRETHTLAFWGRLDFEPNVDAVMWFAREVWPMLRRMHPTARWYIAGKNASPVITETLGNGRVPGAQLLGDVADLRAVANRAAITVLPFRAGGGIKNKLLEAAAMSSPIVASPHAAEGLELPTNKAVMRFATTREQWVSAIDTLWRSPSDAVKLGRAAREWVTDRHTWAGAAAEFIAWANRLGAGIRVAERSTTIRRAA